MVEISSQRVIKVSYSSCRPEISAQQWLCLRDSAEFILCWAYSYCIDFKLQIILSNICSLNINNLETGRQNPRVMGRKRLWLGSWALGLGSLSRANCSDCCWVLFSYILSKAAAVEAVKSDEDLHWYYSRVFGTNNEIWGHPNTLEDSKLAQGKHNQPTNHRTPKRTNQPTTKPSSKTRSADSLISPGLSNLIPREWPLLPRGTREWVYIYIYICTLEWSSSPSHAKRNSWISSLQKTKMASLGAGLTALVEKP